MIAFLTATLAGLVAGGAHVLAGADHLAVVAPLAARRPHRAWAAGLRWGGGHAAGVALVGAAALIFREVLPLDAVSSWSERLVGMSLVGIGLWALTGLLTRWRAQRSSARQLGSDGEARPPSGGPPRAEDGAAVAVGVLHGTAGGAHLVGVLPALALSTRVAAGGYIAAFGLGTIAAMTLFAYGVGVLEGRSAAVGARARTGFMAACAATSIAVGLWWLAP